MSDQKSSKAKNIFAYFNNTASLAALHNARYLQQLGGGELEAVGDDMLGIVRHVRSVVTGESLNLLPVTGDGR